MLDHDCCVDYSTGLALTSIFTANMELNPHPHDARGSLLPRPPPKLNLESPLGSPDLPLTPSDYSGSRNPSQPPSPSRFPANSTSLSPPVNGATEALLAPPSPNPAGDESFLPSSPSSPSATSFKGKQSKKSNPLTDLVESEREYIDLLAGIIRVRGSVPCSALTKADIFAEW